MPKTKKRSDPPQVSAPVPNSPTVSQTESPRAVSLEKLSPAAYYSLVAEVGEKIFTDTCHRFTENGQFRKDLVADACLHAAGRSCVPSDNDDVATFTNYCNWWMQRASYHGRFAHSLGNAMLTYGKDNIAFNKETQQWGPKSPVPMVIAQPEITFHANGAPMLN